MTPHKVNDIKNVPSDSTEINTLFESNLTIAENYCLAYRSRLHKVMPTELLQLSN
ncbi:protein of unknown function [Methylotuvimicrobium alcaliphilum 20Z]|uniref:Uncharacterized protein n=1 Tax=Methylotuvimicrobium alcaliphilum (strain DSM 19304 / NCIMB 14124 / VKM B-2133 / 20Z) TaxID=1091494 RepID=G4T044_META2|nr:protein of unknown function [Methylotuvimicrobium alcaliphilum 20Z]